MEIKTTWDRTLDELDRVANSICVLLLLKDNKLAGRITARRTQNATVHVAFIIYSLAGYDKPIYGYKRMTGFGYDKVNSGIAEILQDNKQLLLEAYGVKVSGDENTWRNDFTSAGFTVMQAI